MATLLNAGPLPVGLRSGMYTPEEEAAMRAEQEQRDLASRGTMNLAIDRGLHQTSAGLADVGGQVVEPFSQGLAQPMFDWAQKQREATIPMHLPGEVKSYTDIGGIGDLGNYIANKAAENLPNVIPTVLGGLAARYGMRNVAGLTPFAKTAIGGSLAALPQQWGEGVGALREDPYIMANTTPWQRFGTSLGYGAATAPLEALPDTLLAQRLAGGGTKALGSVFKEGFKNTMKSGTAHLAKALPEAALTEGIPEALEQKGQQLIQSAFNPNRDTSRDVQDLKEAFAGGWAAGGGSSVVGRGADVAYAQGRGALQAGADLLGRVGDKLETSLNKLRQPKALPTGMQAADDDTILSWDAQDDKERNDAASMVSGAILGDKGSSAELRAKAEEFLSKIKAGASDAWQTLSDAVTENDTYERGRASFDHFVESVKRAHGEKFNAETTGPDSEMYKVFRSHLDPKGHALKSTEYTSKLYQAVKQALVADAKMGGKEGNGPDWHSLADAYMDKGAPEEAITALRGELVRHGIIEDDPGFKARMKEAMSFGAAGDKARTEIVKKYSPYATHFTDAEATKYARIIARAELNYGSMSEEQRKTHDRDVRAFFGKNYATAIEAFKPRKAAETTTTDSVASVEDKGDEEGGASAKTMTERPANPNGPRFVGSRAKETIKKMRYNDVPDEQGRHGGTVQSHGGMWNLGVKDEAERASRRREMAKTIASLRHSGEKVTILKPLEYIEKAGVDPVKVARSLKLGTPGMSDAEARALLKDHPARMLMSINEHSVGMSNADEEVNTDQLAALSEKHKNAVKRFGSAHITPEAAEQVKKILPQLGKQWGPMKGSAQRKAVSDLGYPNAVAWETTKQGTKLHHNLNHVNEGRFTVVLKTVDTVKTDAAIRAAREDGSWTAAKQRAGEYRVPVKHVISAQDLIAEMRTRGRVDPQGSDPLTTFAHGLAAIMNNPHFDHIETHDVWGQKQEVKKEEAVTRGEGMKSARQKRDAKLFSQLGPYFRLEPGVTIGEERWKAQKGQATPDALDAADEAVTYAEEELADAKKALAAAEKTNEKLADREAKAKTPAARKKIEAQMIDTGDLEQAVADADEALDDAREALAKAQATADKYTGDDEREAVVGPMAEQKPTDDEDVTPLDKAGATKLDWNEDGTVKHPATASKVVRTPILDRIEAAKKKATSKDPAVRAQGKKELVAALNEGRDQPYGQPEGPETNLDRKGNVVVRAGNILRLRGGVKASDVTEDMAKTLRLITAARDLIPDRHSDLDVAVDYVARAAAAAREGNTAAKNALFLTAQYKVYKAYSDQLDIELVLHNLVTDQAKELARRMEVFASPAKKYLADQANIDKLAVGYAPFVEYKRFGKTITIRRVLVRQREVIVEELATPRLGAKRKAELEDELVAINERLNNYSAPREEKTKEEVAAPTYSSADAVKADFTETLRFKSDEEIKAEGIARRTRLEQLNAVKAPNANLVDLIERMTQENVLARKELVARKEGTSMVDTKPKVVATTTSGAPVTSLDGALSKEHTLKAKEIAAAKLKRDESLIENKKDIGAIPAKGVIDQPEGKYAESYAKRAAREAAPVQPKDEAAAPKADLVDQFIAFRDKEDALRNAEYEVRLALHKAEGTDPQRFDRGLLRDRDEETEAGQFEVHLKKQPAAVQEAYAKWEKAHNAIRATSKAKEEFIKLHSDELARHPRAMEMFLKALRSLPDWKEGSVVSINHNLMKDMIDHRGDAAWLQREIAGRERRLAGYEEKFKNSFPKPGFIKTIKAELAILKANDLQGMIDEAAEKLRGYRDGYPTPILEEAAQQEAPSPVQPQKDEVDALAKEFAAMGKAAAEASKNLQAAFNTLADALRNGELDKPELVTELRATLKALREATVHLGGAAAESITRLGKLIQKTIGAYQGAGRFSRSAEVREALQVPPVSIDKPIAKEGGAAEEGMAKLVARKAEKMKDLFVTGTETRAYESGLSSLKGYETIGLKAEGMYIVAAMPTELLNRYRKVLAKLADKDQSAEAIEAAFQAGIRNNPDVILQTTVLVATYEIEKTSLNVFAAQKGTYAEAFLKKEGLLGKAEYEDTAYSGKVNKLLGVGNIQMINFLGEAGARFKKMAGKDELSVKWVRGSGANAGHSASAKFNAEAVRVHEELGKPGFAATHDSPVRHEGKFDWRKNQGRSDGADAFGAGTYLGTSDKVHQRYKDKFTAQAEKTGGKAHTYQVSVNATQDEFLDWDNPLSGQSALVKDAVKATLRDLPLLEVDRKNLARDAAIGEDLYMVLEFILGSKAKASDYLQSLGIVGNRYASVGGRDDTHPNYVIFDDSRIETNYVQFNSQDASFANGTGVTPEEMKAVGEYIEKVLGPKVKVELVKDLGGNSASWERLDDGALIRIAASAANPLSKAHHEAMHEFFQRLMDANPEAATVLERAASTRAVRRQVEKFFEGDANYAAIKEALDDPHERVAYMYQLWAAKKLDLGPKTEGWFAKVSAFFRKVTGMITDGQHAEALMEHFHKGEMSEPNAVARVLRQDAARRAEYSANAAKYAQELYKNVAQLVVTAQNELLDSGNKGLEKIGRMMSNETGAQDKDISFVSARTMKSNQMVYRMTEALKGASDKAMAEALEALQQGRQASTPEALRVQQRVRKLLDDLYTYATEEQPDGKPLIALRKEKDYFTRAWDPEAILNGKAEFVALLMKDGNLKQDVAEGIAETLIQNRGATPLTEDEYRVGYSPFMAAANKRVLTFIKSPEFSKFQQKDMVAIMTTYIAHVSHRAEYARRFGEHGEKLNKMVNDAVGEAIGVKDWDAAQKAEELHLTMTEKAVRAAATDAKGKVDWTSYNEAMKKAGYPTGETTISQVAARLSVGAREKYAAFEPQLRRAQRAIMAMEGTLGSDIKAFHRSLSSGLIVYQNMRLLQMSLFSQIIDPFGVMVRGGDIPAVWDTFKRGLAGTVAGWRGKPIEDRMTKLAMQLGIVDAGNFLNSQGNAYSGLFMGSRAHWLNDRLFRWNGVEGFAQGTRVGATAAAISFIISHSQDATRDEHSDRYLAELGLTKEDVKVVGDDQLEWDNKKIQNAIYRWVDGAIIRPNAALRPSWASDPHWALLFHMKQFTYAFQKILLERVAHEMKHGNHQPVLALALSVPAIMAADYIRGMIATGGGEPPWKKHWKFKDYVENGIERAGLYGIPQIAGDIYKWGPGEAFGPAAEQAIRTAKIYAKNPDKGVATEKAVRYALPMGEAMKHYVYDPLVKEVK